MSWVGIVLTTQNQEKTSPIVPYKMPKALHYSETVMRVASFLHSGMESLTQVNSLIRPIAAQLDHEVERSPVCCPKRPIL